MDPLEQLRDLHMPDPVSVWPPVFGWWIVLLFAIICVAIGLWIKRYRQATAPRRVALAALIDLHTSFNETQDITKLMAGLSQLIRRYALVCFGRQNVAGLTGAAWLTFLDERGKSPLFSSERIQQALTAVPYGSQGSVDAEEMVTLVKRWIKQTPVPSKRTPV
ncbi:MAG: hypothetical protein NPIRA02_32540 [Nitrospirales bacterium]|nr:MAG: hypothetical protein NPIRA02_32540 [Nitrospirales bacterium]